MTSRMPDTSRRQLIAFAAVLPLLTTSEGVLGAEGSAAFSGGSQGGTLADRIGVCTHLQDTGSAYHDWMKVRSCLDYIGVRHLRTAAPWQRTHGYAIMSAAATAGFLFTFTIRAHRVPLADSITDLEAFAVAHPHSIVAIEGANEVDHSPITFGGLTDPNRSHGPYPAAQAYQSALYAAIRSSRILRDIPVLGFTGYDILDCAGGAITVHNYPRNAHTLSGALPGVVRTCHALNASKPIFITETGFHTLPEAKPFPGTDETTQASLIEDAVTAAPRAGIARTFLYELIDSYPPNNSMETHFGLFRYDYSPKPAATRLRQMQLSRTRA